MNKLNSAGKQQPSVAGVMLFSPQGLRPLGFRIWSFLARRLWLSRDIILLLAWRDVSVRYRQSVLGWVWAVVSPIAAAGLFAFLVRHRVLPVGDIGLPYLLFALSGLTLWQYFSSVLISAINSWALLQADI